MDTIIAALILAVVGALYKIFAQQKAINRLESKLDNLQKQLARLQIFLCKPSKVA